jgi:hypothetical protein
MFEHLEWENVDADFAAGSSSSLTVGLYDKNGRRVRIARKKEHVPVVDELDDGSSDDSAGAPECDDLKVVSKRFIKVSQSSIFSPLCSSHFFLQNRNKPKGSFI